MEIGGYVVSGFEPVRDAFLANFEQRGEHGAAFAATLHGDTVVDLWGGIADSESGASWQRDTLQVTFSGTKGFVAVCLLLLIERGQLELDLPVAHYWPEFAAAGKNDVLVRHVASHQAGLPALHEPVNANEVLDGQAMAERLAHQPPYWPAGERLCYHALTYGWLCGELIRRVDGRTVGDYFADEVARLLDLELWIGLPRDNESRVSVLTGSLSAASAMNRECERVAHDITDNPPLFVGPPDHWNSAAFHAAQIPAAGAIGTARSIARLYGCLACGGELEGARLMKPETVQLGRTELARGYDACFGWPLAFGVGFALQTEEREFGPPTSAYGHCGAGGSAHGAWPDQTVGFSYAMNELRDDMSRSGALLESLHLAVHDTIHKGTG